MSTATSYISTDTRRLNRRALPLIRYRLGDRVRIEADSDGGLWSGRRLVIADSSGATFASPDGAASGPPALAEAMGRHPAAVDYAIAQTDATSAGVLAEGGLRDPRVAVRVVADPGELPQTPAGKRRRFAAL